MSAFQLPLLFFLVAFFSPVSSLNSQGRALLAWKQTFNASFNALSGWSPGDRNPCTWFGVTCSARNEVVAINLKYIDLFGSVLSDFRSLTTLNELVLRGTNLSGAIPQTIGELQQLKVLDLSENSLTGEIPDAICTLQKLERLHLNGNRLQGPIPAAIGNLAALKEVTLFDNQLDTVALSVPVQQSSLVVRLRRNVGIPMKLLM